MTGTAADMRARLSALLPLRWFPDATPVLSALLAGLSDGGDDGQGDRAADETVFDGGSAALVL